jgi:peptidoglycan/xylan/chitin deacetylase (PgdA/CDA1 family)
MRRGCLATLLVLATLAHVAAQPARAQNAPTPSPPPIYVTLWFDTEDYILTEDDDATKRLAEMLTRLGVRATFKIVGEKARVLEARKRTDVIAALQRHDIGYHSNTHSQQPTIAVYLQHAGWDDGRAEFARREAQGARDVARIVGAPPVAYGQPGSAWAPQAYPALRDMGIRLYLDEADHVGIDDQPFYYGGLLNVFKMRSNLVRMNLNGGASLSEGEAAFRTVASRLATKGGGTISIYYHPNEWVQTEFWDAVNFSRGANPPREQWKRPGTRPVAETEAAFRDFEAFVRFMAAQPGVRFVTATDLIAIYADRAKTRAFTRDELVAIARDVSREITFQRRADYTISAADAFGLLTQAMAEYVDRGAWPTTTPVIALDGPARAFTASAGGTRSTTVAWPAFAQAVRDTAGYLKSARRVPDEIWIGAESLSPADFLATVAAVAETVGAGAKPPTTVERREGRFTADRLVADDTTTLWGWPIFPEGFHAPGLMALARLQAWTLKPAVRHDAR